MKAKLNVYIAAPWICGGDANELRKVLEAKNYLVTSAWLTRSTTNLPVKYDYNKDLKFTKRESRLEAERDLHDIGLSDVLVVLNQQKSEGKVVEQGYALAKGIPVIVIGPKTNVFQNLAKPRMQVVKSVKAMLRSLKKIRKKR